MCQQNFIQHTCTHFTDGTLTTCATPSTPGHQRKSFAVTHPGPCPACQMGQPPFISLPLPNGPTSARPSPQPPTYSTLPPRLTYTIHPQQQTRPVRYVLHPQYQYPAYTVAQPSLTNQNSHPSTPIVFYPALSTPAYAYDFQTPPPFPPFPPGQVPSWYPRETRYEVSRGVLRPVEHFAAPTTPNPLSARGWNSVYGYDNGPLPPRTANRGKEHLARELSHVAPSGEGANGGSSSSTDSTKRGRSGYGVRSGHSEIGVNEIGSDVVEVGSRASGSEVGEGSRRISFREPLAAAMSDDISRTSSSKRERDVGAVPDVHREGEGASISGASPVPPEQAPSMLATRSAVEANPYESAAGFGRRITWSEMERNLGEVEGAGLSGRGTGREGEVSH